MPPRKTRLGGPPQGFRLLVLPCEHCFRCYCLCIVDPAEVIKARAAVRARHVTSVRRAELGSRFMEGWAA